MLARSRVAIFGLGALGSVSSEILARSGVGHLRLIDFDTVELSNLQRCALYTEHDAETSALKALAAATHLEQINSSIEVEPCVKRVDSSNVAPLLKDVDLVLDGSDNFELRYVLNEATHQLNIPWIYTGVLKMLGTIMPITPEGPCLSCLFPVPPEPGSYPNATTDGVLASTTRIAATTQATLALRMLLGKMGADVGTATLFHLDVWDPSLEMITVKKVTDCPVCGK